MIPAGTTTDHPTLTAARSLHMLMELARMRDLPMPFCIRGWNSGRAELQFHHREDVVAWLSVLDVTLSSLDGENVRATGSVRDFLDTQVTVCAFVPEAVA